MKITEEEQLRRKSRIIHEAFHLFCREGVDRVTIAEIAKASGVSEASLYRYYSTKQDLVVETTFKLWAEISVELTQDIDQTYTAKTGYEQVEILLGGFRNLFENHMDYVLFSYDYKLYLIRHQIRLTDLQFGELSAPLHQYYLDAIAKGLADGSIRSRGPDISPEDLYWSIWGLMRGYVAKIAIYDRMYDGENMWRSRFDLAMELIKEGLRSSPRQETCVNL